MAGLNLPRQRTFQANAAIWKRIVAFIIDLFIIDLVLFWPFERTIKKIIPADYTSIRSVQEFFTASPEITGMLTALTVVMGALAVMYFVLMEYRVSQTIGKMLLNIYVVSEIKEAKGIRFWQSLVRSVLWIPMFPFIVFWIIDPLYVLLNQNNQRLLEYISRTRTVENYMGI